MPLPILPLALIALAAVVLTRGKKEAPAAAKPPPSPPLPPAPQTLPAQQLSCLDPGMPSKLLEIVKSALSFPQTYGPDALHAMAAMLATQGFALGAACLHEAAAKLPAGTGFQGLDVSGLVNSVAQILGGGIIPIPQEGPVGPSQAECIDTNLPVAAAQLVDHALASPQLYGATALSTMASALGAANFPKASACLMNASQDAGPGAIDIQQLTNMLMLALAGLSVPTPTPGVPPAPAPGPGLPSTKPLVHHPECADPQLRPEATEVVDHALTNPQVYGSTALIAMGGSLAALGFIKPANCLLQASHTAGPGALDPQQVLSMLSAAMGGIKAQLPG